MDSLAVGGLAPFSSLDYPGCLAAVVFCRGCAWRCPYCHNAHLRDEPGRIAWREVLAHLGRRQGLLEAVVFSGGEPLLQPGLPGAVRQVRGLGFKAALHTGGSPVAALQDLLADLDWVGFDLKAPFDRYPGITGDPRSGVAAEAALGLLAARGRPFEVRTTVAPGLLTLEALREMAAVLAGFGVRAWVLQAFRAEGCRDPRLVAEARLAPPLSWLAAQVKAAVPGLEIRIRQAYAADLAV